MIVAFERVACIGHTDKRDLALPRERERDGGGREQAKRIEGRMKREKRHERGSGK